jgi:hypothetical protein
VHYEFSSGPGLVHLYLDHLQTADAAQRQSFARRARRAVAAFALGGKSLVLGALADDVVRALQRRAAAVRGAEGRK